MYRQGIPPGYDGRYTPPGYDGRYTPPGYVLPPYHPGYTRPPPAVLCYMATSHTQLGVPQRSPGLTLGETRGWEASEPLRTLRVLGLVYPPAQSYSALPGNK